MQSDNDKQYDHWLVRPSSIRLLWQVFAAVLAVTVLAQLFISVKGYFGVDGWFGFGALFGFLSCVAMVLVAKALGVVLKRDEDYYTARSLDEESGND
jgi:Na+/proline symporter